MRFRHSDPLTRVFELANVAQGSGVYYIVAYNSNEFLQTVLDLLEPHIGDSFVFGIRIESAGVRAIANVEDSEPPFVGSYSAFSGIAGISACKKAEDIPKMLQFTKKMRPTSFELPIPKKNPDNLKD